MRTKAVLAVAVVLTAAVSCSSSADSGQKSTVAQKGGTVSGMQLTSEAFAHMGEIPSRYTCKGQNISPPLSFINIPKNAKSLALIVDDPDAPDPKAPKTVWVHWVIYNIPAGTSSLEESAKPLPKGALEGINDWKRPGWSGPCPPISRHRYFFKLYALSENLPALRSPTKKDLLKAMEGKILQQAELIGTYQK